MQETQTPRAATAVALVPSWLRHYQRDWLRPDVIAGLSAGAVVIPQAMAYATVAGLPVQVGLYTAFLPMVIYALLGSSRPLSVSTTGTLAILTAEALERFAGQADGAALVAALATLTLLVGAALLLGGLLRLGFVANFISDPVLTGFKAGIAIVILFKQIPALLGIHIARGSFTHNLADLWAALPQTSSITLVVGAMTIGMLLLMKRFSPSLPSSLIAVAAGIAAVALFALPQHGVETVGHIPTGLPTLTLPDVSVVEELWVAAVAIALMSFTETAAAGRAFARSDEPAPVANRELIATGLANAGGALLGAMPAGGGTTQTTVNRLAGARTQVAELVTAAATLATMALLAPLIGKMPQATLAAVVVVSVVGLIRRAEFRAIRQIRRTEFLWALTALAGVVLLGTLKGILVAICVSLVALAYQESDPPLYEVRRKPGTNVFRQVCPEHPEDESFVGLLLLRTEGRIFFANAPHLARKAQALLEQSHQRVFVLDLSAVFDIEYTALMMLAAAEKQLRSNGRVLCLAGLNPEVLALVRRSPLGAALGNERMFFDLEQAVVKCQHFLR
ncbi:MAG TPA: SulP family inorganic anion transporter [Steroidobacteraceae bacterium]|nr:SulP family inorganic anion transporter [Steroidobacteraceae bacterium]